MQIDAVRSVKGSMDGDFDTSSVAETTAATATENVTSTVMQPAVALANGQKVQQEEGSEGKEPSKNTIDSVVSEVNQKMRMKKTRCEYSYDEPTKRVSIKVYDKDTDKLIREVPPEKSLEMLQKMWELAGIIVDEKR